ncbi:FGGY family carbohydrate kinase [Prosthecodimorpha staleyi]|uniref:Carbohydrate kinase n=1 Tax=Prosthecodimorpha staleyi TaxID=2840188 RepID=A0A947D0L1_9HYPH|nr:FGGY family carbohydrate kinase [Prosthecodimorpha staleyi]MBT9288053.1 carbohydrate kinase [Prosthecodimorpha staleyi]
MDPVLIALDSGTTAVKAAAFDRDGRLVASAERPNAALRRDSSQVEQDMAATRDDAFAALAECAAAVPGRAAALIVTGQGDGLWPIGADFEPVGRAMTWLDGRARPLVAELRASGRLDAIERTTYAQPTAASQSLQLLWLQRHDPARLARIAHALRLKEWLFLSLTGRLAGEPSAVLPTWGDWRSGLPSPIVEETLGLDRGIALLPPLEPVGACRAGLGAEAAGRIGLPSGLPVLIGPGDVQSTLIGLGLGVRPGVSRASIFGTSAIHGSHRLDPAAMAAKPPGAMVQPFVLGDGYVCTHPSFNGATALGHAATLFAGLPPGPVAPVYSGVVLHPFFEPGGERAPVTSPHASAAAFGLSGATDPAAIAWAAREALAFVTRHAYAMMGGDGADLVVGGGLAGDAAFMQFLATALQAPVRPVAGGQAGLRGLATIAAGALGWASGADLADRFVCPAETRVEPETGPVATYAAGKYEVFARTLGAISDLWPDIAGLKDLAAATRRSNPK